MSILHSLYLFHQTCVFFSANSFYFVTALVVTAWKVGSLNKSCCHFDNPIFTRLWCKNFVFDGTTIM